MCFYLSYQTRCRTIGIEYDERIYADATANQLTAASGRSPCFVMKNAEQYPVPANVDRCYFFHPFSVEILRAVLAKRMDSYCENLRELQLFFYYPSNEYLAYLMTQDGLMLVEEIDCRDLFLWNDLWEKILIEVG